MLRKTIYLLLFWVAFIPIGSAQTITWLVQPKYDSISYLNESVFKCKLGKQVQLVNAKGRELLVPAADSVTNYCENRALILDKKGDKFIIRSIIDESGLLTKVNGDYYTNNYSYFSGGFVSVVGQSGKAGYLDVNGNLAIPCQYRIARPFIQGWASVEPAKRKQQTLYIDSKGNLLKIRGFHDGKVVMGSSFNSLGEALVTYYDNDNAVINTKGEVVREYVRKENVIPIRTYDFSFDESGKNTIPVFSVEISFDTEPTPFLSGQLLGYKKADHFVALPQFSKAEKFADGSAIVCHNGKHGIVKLLEGSFSGEFVGEDLIVSPGKQASSYTYNLVVPESMKSESLAPFSKESVYVGLARVVRDTSRYPAWFRLVAVHEDTLMISVDSLAARAAKDSLKAEASSEAPGLPEKLKLEPEKLSKPAPPKRGRDRRPEVQREDILETEELAVEEAVAE